MAIASFLGSCQGHPSAEDIHRALRKRFPTMSLSTVYNTIRRLQREGLVHELLVEPGKVRFDPGTEAHSHLVCLQCRSIVDLDRAVRVELAPGERRGYRVLHSHVTFFGLCPDCRSGTAQSPHKETS